MMTLYFEAEKEDGLRTVGFSKERRVDPQIVVGLLVERAGFLLEVAYFHGNEADKHTIVPVIEAFGARHKIENMVVVADAGMLSVANPTLLYEVLPDVQDRPRRPAPVRPPPRRHRSACSPRWPCPARSRHG